MPISRRATHSRAAIRRGAPTITSRGGRADGDGRERGNAMRRNMIETLMGAVVLAVAAIFLVFAYSRADVGEVRGYVLNAKFDRVDGVKPGADVRISGIKVGSVLSQKLNPETYLA